jgi:AcrR family transcriptional regulator
MPRRCACCWHPNRANLEARILNGASVQLIAAEIGVNQSAVYRHFRLHVRGRIAAALNDRAISTHVADMADRLASLLDETERIREQALATGDGKLLLAAVQQDRETVSVLMARLGIDHTELICGIREAQALIQACAAVLPRHPAALRDLIESVPNCAQGPEVVEALKSIEASRFTKEPA